MSCSVLPNLSLGPLAISKTAWNVAVMSMVSVPGMELVRLLVTGASFRKHRALGLPGFNAQALEQGQRPEQRIRSVATVSAPPEVAMRLNLDESSPVVVRRRVFLLEGQAAALCDSYYPAEWGKRDANRAARADPRWSKRTDRGPRRADSATDRAIH